MQRKSLFVLLVAMVSLTVAVPVLADGPAVGTVVEGVSVPGVALGDTRAQVLASYGVPYSCRSGYAVDDMASCMHLVDGGGHVRIHYRGSDGGLPSASPDDVVTYIVWSDSVSGWTTKEGGVNTTWARTVRQDPEAVLAVYPNAVITYGLFDAMTQARDYELGITIEWHYHFYSGFLGVSIAITAPSEPPPPPPPRDKFVRIVSIDLTAIKGKKGQYEIRAFAKAEDDRTLAASGATVYATWQLPDGSTMQVESVASGSGSAYFGIPNATKGTYSLTVNDVVLEEHRFESDSSVLSNSVTIGGKKGR